MKYCDRCGTTKGELNFWTSGRMTECSLSADLCTRCLWYVEREAKIIFDKYEIMIHERYRRRKDNMREFVRFWE